MNATSLPRAREKPVVVRGRIDPDNSTSREIDDTVQQTLSRGESLYGLDLELLRRINPELIITQGLCAVCAVGYDDVMAAAGTLRPPARVLSLSPSSLDEVLSDITRMGTATGTPERAQALVDTLRERVERVAARVPEGRARPRVACLEWLDPCTPPATGCRRWWSWRAGGTSWRPGTNPRPEYPWKRWWRPSRR